MRTSRFELRCTDAERQRWEAAATALGLPVTEWSRRALDLAAGQALVELRPMTVEQQAELRRLAEESQTVLSVIVAPPKAKPALCPGCQRKGSPACDDCRKAWGLAGEGKG